MASPQLQKLLLLPPTIRTIALTRAFAVVSPSSLRYTRSFSRSASSSDQTPTPSAQSSVNHEEVSHFNKLASSWWDPHGSSRLLHLMNPLRHDFIRRCQASSSSSNGAGKAMRYLDIGCGGGIFAESAARLATAKSVTAIDPTPEVIAVARKHQRHDPTLLEAGRLEYKQIPIEDLTLPASPEEGYDVITVFEVLEHIRKPSAFLEKCLPHLRPGGWIIGSTIARTNVSWFTTKFVAEDVLRIVPRGTHDWNQYIQPNELKQWAKIQKELAVTQEGAGWEVMGVVYVPGLGWKPIKGSEEIGNYFFGMRRKEE